MCACFLLVSGLVSMEGPNPYILGKVLFSRICFISGDTHWNHALVVAKIFLIMGEMIGVDTLWTLDAELMPLLDIQNM